LKSFFRETDEVLLILLIKNYPPIKFFEIIHYSYLCHKRTCNGKAY
jgi:hypothetical protein